MTNDLPLRGQALPAADASSPIPGPFPKALPTAAARRKRARAAKASAKDPGQQLALAPDQDGGSPASAMSGNDFYRAACSEAYARLLAAHEG
jgi:hypothetical protein